MSIADDLFNLANQVGKHEHLIRTLGGPLIAVLQEAIAGGVSHDALVASVKATMTAASDEEMRKELERL